MALPPPILILNFKAYQEATGNNAVKLAKMAAKAAKSSGIWTAVAVQAADIYPVANSVSIPVLAQHIDAVAYGAHTGSMPAHVARQAGASGTLLNHSERRLDFAQIKAAVQRARDAGLIACVCAADALEAKALAGLKPDLVAVEPPELISGSVSVTDAQPELVQAAAQAIKRESASTLALCGAGVKTAQDVRTALRLGAQGVLLASGFTKASDPEKYLRQLLAGFG